MFSRSTATRHLANPSHLTETTKESMTFSDHHPITVTLTFPDKFEYTYIWRLDPSVLTDFTKEQEIRNCLTNYFTENDTPDTSKLTQWEAHKCVVRGKLISL